MLHALSCLLQQHFNPAAAHHAFFFDVIGAHLDFDNLADPMYAFSHFRKISATSGDHFSFCTASADGPGIQYVLSVDSVGPDGESGYTLVMTYLDAEGQGQNKSFTTKGKKQVIKKTVDNKQKTAYKLTPNDGDAPVYFVVVNDTTLRLVNDSLQEAVSDLNYDIIQVKK